ncbi:MAG: VanZ family protein [Candidatus Rokubacteria bacterium]|nr:VanZ family protein [Candidatus Rokubacteria bacterium]
MRPGHWVPPTLWMALILLLSTDVGSAQHTGRILEPLLRWLIPGITPAQLAATHAVVRKAAHFTEYAVLALLWARALALGRGLGPAASTTGAVVISLAWAMLDEAHQSFVPTRSPSLADVGVDALGAMIAAGLRVVGGRRLTRRV